MTHENSLDLLKNSGDPLEKVISRHDELMPVLVSYANVWAHHIYPRRIGDGSRVVADWMNFAGSHYTALIRLFHAYRAKETVLRLCKEAEAVATRTPTDADYELLLGVHSACAAYWENLGSTIDNFFRASADARKLLGFKLKARSGDPLEAETINGKTVSETKNPKLAYAFARRTQFIHSRLIPKKFEEGMIVFDLGHFGDETTNWTTEQQLKSPVLESADTQIAGDWVAVISELSASWAEFFAWIQAEDKKRPTPHAAPEAPSNSSFSNFGASTQTTVFVVPRSPSGDPRFPPSGSYNSYSP